MAAPAKSTSGVAVVPSQSSGQPDPFVERYVDILKKASRPEIEAAVEKGPSAMAAAATQVLSTLKGGWASIKRLWAKTPEDRAFEIYYKLIHGRAPPGFKEKITETFFNILSFAKSSLKTLARFVGIAVGGISLQKLAGLLKGSRVALLDARYGPINKKITISKMELGGRMYLVSRYAPIASPNFRKKLENLADEMDVERTDPRFGPLLAKVIKKKFNLILSPAAAARVAEGGLSMNTGRLSTSRYNVIGTPPMFSLAKEELNKLALELGVKSARVLTNPAMAKVLAERLLGKGRSLTPSEATALTQGLQGSVTGPNRMTRLRYKKFAVKIPTRISSVVSKLAVDLQKNPSKFTDDNIDTVINLLEAEGITVTVQMVKDVIRNMGATASRIGVGRYSNLNVSAVRSAINAKMTAAARQAETTDEKKKIANRQEQMSALISALMEGVPDNREFVINNKTYKLGKNVHKGPITMANVARGELVKKLQGLSVTEAINLAVKYRKMATNINREMAALGIGSIGNYTSTDDLMRIRERYFNRMSNGLRAKLMRSLNSKARRDASALRTLSLNSNRLRSWARHLGAYKNDEYRSDFISSLRNGIQRAANNRNSTTALRRLRQLRSNASGLGVNQNIASAERQIMDKLRREQNEKRRIQNANRASRGLAPLPRNRGIPYYPNQPTPRGYGNLFPTFEAPSNRPQYSAVPRPMPQIPPMPIMANMGRQAQTPSAPFPSAPELPIENILPPGEKNAVTNVGGANKAINLVENAGGPSNVVKTANILKNVGGSPEAAVAAGANAKNVKIVLQLGGPNNALKVASAVPKLKKRRRSKKKASKKKVAKPPRVKEIKKLIEYLGSKENLVKRLPNKKNKEKKLTKKQIVSKITRHLLRKN